jgi:hypothetical protein
LSNACREQIIATFIWQVAQVLELGWSTAFLGYFFLLLKRSIWCNKDVVSKTQWIAVNEVNKKSRSDKVHEVHSERSE